MIVRFSKNHRHRMDYVIFKNAYRCCSVRNTVSRSLQNISAAPHLSFPYQSSQRRMHMIKVIIVDDELLIREGLRDIINWNDFDMEIVGVAEDGKDALKIC